ncbi:MAG TPA: cysteine peptidase family C39 domain-containing protein [Polyangia bacterium]|jgi:ABC-type bacteriocin/lantibiotic exporter with double-glycine peptidase domain
MKHLLRVAMLATVVASGCYTGSARSTSWKQASGPGWVVVKDIGFVPQQRQDDCGAAALAMTLGYWRAPVREEEIVREIPPRDGGIRAGELRDLARRRGFQAFLVEGTFEDLETQLRQGRPIVVGLAKPVLGGKAILHYEVVVGFNKTTRHVLSLDPADGLRDNTVEGFAHEWAPADRLTLIIFRPEARPAAVAAAP